MLRRQRRGAWLRDLLRQSLVYMRRHGMRFDPFILAVVRFREVGAHLVTPEDRQFAKDASFWDRAIAKPRTPSDTVAVVLDALFRAPTLPRRWNRRT